MKNVPVVRLVERDEAGDLPELSDGLRGALTEVAGAAREGLLAMSVSVGLCVMAEMMEEELTAKVGPKHAKIPDRTASRHASAPGSVVLRPTGEGVATAGPHDRWARGRSRHLRGVR